MDAILFWHRFEGRWLRGHRISLSRTPGKSAIAEATRELAEI